MLHWARKAEESLKVFFSPGLLFEALNFKYVGPIQGHRLDVVLETFENVKEMLASGSGPVLVHALTEEFADQDAFRDMERRSIEAVEGKKALEKPRGEA